MRTVGDRVKFETSEDGKLLTVKGTVEAVEARRWQGRNTQLVWVRRDDGRLEPSRFANTVRSA